MKSFNRPEEKRPTPKEGLERIKARLAEALGEMSITGSSVPI